MILAVGLVGEILPENRDKLTYKETLFLMKEELHLTSEVIAAQNIASRAIVLRQHYLSMRTTELLAIVYQIKELAYQDERLDLQQISD